MTKKEPTTQMKSNLYRAHGLTFEEYEQNVQCLLQVEHKREKEYEKGKKIVSSLSRKLAF